MVIVIWFICICLSLIHVEAGGVEKYHKELEQKESQKIILTQY